MKDVIEIKDYTVYYGDKRVLDHLNLQILKNTAYTLVGPSGCGKSTLLLSIANLLPENSVVSGTIQGQLKHHYSIIFQEYGLFPWKTVYENIVLPLKIKKGLVKTETVIELAQSLGIESKLDAYPERLSGGQKQRVAIARAWIANQPLLLMDEPFSAIDALTRENLQDEILRLNHKMDRTMVTVTHSIEEAVYLGRYILVMTPQGRIYDCVDNVDFMHKGLRKQASFYTCCQKIRQLLEEVSR